jgi:hypothetical protein
MNWKKAILVATVIGFTLFSTFSCRAMHTTTVITKVAPATEIAQAGTVPGKQDQFSDNGTRPGGQPGGLRQMDWAAAAEKLRFTEDALKAAFGDLVKSLPDFTAVAEKLGVTEEALPEALDMFVGNLPQNGNQPGLPPQGGPPQGNAPDNQLNVNES